MPMTPKAIKKVVKMMDGNTLVQLDRIASTNTQQNPEELPYHFTQKN